MSNAKEEFLKHVGSKEVLCASMSYQDCWNHDKPTEHFKLPVGYTEEQGADFVESLDFKYDDGGGQELFGIIWYKDGTWSDRGEYDGSEWWNYLSCPAIPESLNK